MPHEACFTFSRKESRLAAGGNKNFKSKVKSEVKVPGNLFLK
jgi:hypothetical protein